MMQTIKILGVLLAYPTADLQEHMSELKAAIESDELLTGKAQKNLFQHMNDIARRPLIRLQEDYVALFDRSRVHSLYLFEHVHGESRDRGQAMVDLIGQYRAQGFELKARELPDYLPLFLEFLSAQPFVEAQSSLGEIVHIIAAIGAKLKARQSSYHHVFRALESLTEIKADKKFVEAALAQADEVDESLEALDKEWEETPAFDDVGNAACAVCPQSTPSDPTTTRSM